MSEVTEYWSWLIVLSKQKGAERHTHPLREDTKFVLEEGDVPIHVSVLRGFRNEPYLHFEVHKHWLRLECAPTDAPPAEFYGYFLKLCKTEEDAKIASMSAK